MVITRLEVTVHNQRKVPPLLAPSMVMRGLEVRQQIRDWFPLSPFPAMVITGLEDTVHIRQVPTLLVPSMVMRGLEVRPQIRDWFPLSPFP